jgi:membrane protein YdbS with pleckstrin-like domain
MTESTDPAPVTPTEALPDPAPVEVPVVATAEADTGWRPLPRAARNVQVMTGALIGAVVGVLAWFAFVLRLDFGLGLKIVLLVVAMLALSAYAGWVAYRSWRATAWRLDARGLQVRRGKLFHREILVPRSRVQHLDLERGPVERRYGLATIVVHTAGTRLQALRQSGLAEADAVALRDALVPDTDADDDAV